MAAPVSKRIAEAVYRRFGRIRRVPDDLPDRSPGVMNERSVCRRYRIDPFRKPVPNVVRDRSCFTVQERPAEAKHRPRDRSQRSCSDPRECCRIAVDRGRTGLLVFCGDGSRLRRVFERRGRQFPNEHLDQFQRRRRRCDRAHLRSCRRRGTRAWAPARSARSATTRRQSRRSRLADGCSRSRTRAGWPER